MTNFFVYKIGTLLVVGALAYGAHLLGVTPRWIAIGVTAMIGVGVMGAIVKTRRPQSS
jgi:hypothetical protein